MRMDGQMNCSPLANIVPSTNDKMKTHKKLGAFLWGKSMM